MSNLPITAERRFYTGMSLGILLIVFLGFFQSFYLRPFFPDNPASSYPMVIVHGILFSSWVILFVIQVNLIRKKNLQAHQKLGLFAGLLSIAVIIQGSILAISAVKIGRVDPRFGDALPLVLPVVDILLFTTFISLGFIYRKRAQRHKRFMLLAMLNFINAAIGRIPGTTTWGPVMPLLVFFLFVAAMAIWDYKSRKKIHRVTLIGGIISILSLPLRFMMMGTEVWQGFEEWVLSI